MSLNFCECGGFLRTHPTNKNSMNHAQSTQNKNGFRWKWIIALCGFLIVSAFFLFSEHQAHFLGFLPYLLLLLCPFMHFFMHGSHGGAKNAGSPDNQDHSH